MNLTTCLNKQRYTAPSAEIVHLGQTLSILETSSIGLTREDGDRIWEVDELEDHGEL